MFEKVYREAEAKINTADEGGVRYSLNESFINQIDSWDGKTIGFSFVVGTTSDALIKAGIPNKQIRWDASKIKTTMETHNGMSLGVIKQVPNLLENPVVVIDSKKDAQSKIVMGELYDDNGKIVTAVLKLNPSSKKGNQLDLIKISSTQGRGHIESLFKYEDGKGVTIRYVNKNRIQNWLNVNRLQLPLHSFNLDSNDIIPNSTENVKQNGKLSLSSPDTAPKKYGSYNVYGEDVMLEGEVKSAEDPPSAEITAPTSKKEITSPMRADVENDLLSQSAKSFGITKPGDYVQVQRQVFDTLEKEGFFSDEGSRSRTVTNRDSSMQVEINKKGIKETFNYDNYGKFSRKYKGVKLETVRMLPQIIENGKLVSDNVDNYHNVESSVKFAYIESEVEIGGQSIAVKIDIKKSPQKNKFWVHSINIKEKVNGLPVNDSKSLERDYVPTDSTESISNTDENVKQNGKLSLSSPNTAPKKYGSYNVYGEDVMLEGKVKSAEDPPSAEITAPTSKKEITTPTRESIAEKKKAVKENKFPMTPGGQSAL